MTSREVRRLFLDFFAERGHRIIPSSPLVLPDDPTLLFANAGMNQFKDAFTGRRRPEAPRAASVQKCLRVSGKHNDLEQVGRTPRHHTFFEMLGNFSFGDYFKREAIGWAWELVAGRLGLPPDRLWVTVFGGSAAAPADEEAERLWREVAGLPPERILRLGEEDNFWRMGDTGPCGPSSEIHYDLGEDLASARGESTPATDERRYVEIWNLVFMQFDQRGDGRLEPLPAPCIDTGMGLERITAVLQGKRSNYDTDLFLPILEAASEVAGARYGERPEADVSLRVIADHARAVAFLVADGVVPANDKRGYVLRRILRRAILHGRKLGIRGSFLDRVVPAVVHGLGEVYPELVASRAAILEICRREEERFAATVSTGLDLLEEAIGKLAGPKVVPGGELFRLYDTFGLPLDLARDVAAERGVELDLEGFEEELAKQRERARASWKGGRGPAGEGGGRVVPTEFVGHRTLQVDGARVVAARAVGVGDEPPLPVTKGKEVAVHLDTTPFYAEAGGQVGDTGILIGRNFRGRVVDTVRGPLGIEHRVLVEEGELEVNQLVRAEVDRDRRDSIRRNHTATHLLHAALREIVGPHVKQAGSLVAPDRLRFDFSHFAGLADRTLADIEELVNEKILGDEPVLAEEMGLDDALRTGAVALFGEKYGDRVRVVSIGDFSRELCGGTHCERTGEIGLFKLVQERGVASGTRRVEAITGEGSLERFRQTAEIVRSLESLLAVPREDLVAEVERRLARLRALERQLQRERARSVKEALYERAESAQVIEGVKVLSGRADGLDPQETRELADALRRKLRSGVVILGRREGPKASLLVAVTEDLQGRVPAGELVRELAGIVGGGGGGKPDLAEAGGRDPSRLDEALEAALEAVARRVAASV